MNRYVTVQNFSSISRSKYKKRIKNIEQKKYGIRDEIKIGKSREEDNYRDATHASREEERKCA